METLCSFGFQRGGDSYSQERAVTEVRVVIYFSFFSIVGIAHLMGTLKIGMRTHSPSAGPGPSLLALLKCVPLILHWEVLPGEL